MEFSRMAIQFHDFTLPSRGVLYGDRCPEGVVKVRTWTVGEEEILAGGHGSVSDRIRLMVDKCSELPNGLKSSELLTSDRLAMLLAVRHFTVGSRYNYQWVCRQCRGSNVAEVNLVTDLDERTPDVATRAVRELTDPETGKPLYPDFIYAEPISITLPVSGETLKMRFMRTEDESVVQTRVKQSQFKAQASGAPLSYSLAVGIVAIGERDNLPILQREDFMRSLVGRDMARLRTVMQAAETGLDMTLYRDCRHCATLNKVTLGLDEEFFRPSCV
jgi:hypothetical protein